MVDCTSSLQEQLWGEAEQADERTRTICQSPASRMVGGGKLCRWGAAGDTSENAEHQSRRARGPPSPRPLARASRERSSQTRSPADAPTVMREKRVLRFLCRAFQTGAKPKSVSTSEDQRGAAFNERTVELPRPSRTSRLPVRGHQSSGRKGAPRGSWPIAKVIYDGNTSCLLLKAFSVMISSPLHINNHFQYHQNDTNPKAIAITFCERSNCI